MFVEILCFVVCRYWSFGGVLFVFDLFTFFVLWRIFVFFLYAFYIVYVYMCMLLPVLNLFWALPLFFFLYKKKGEK